MNDRSRFVSRVLLPLTIMFVLSTVGSLGTAAAPWNAPTIVVPYGASEYKYQVVPVDDGIGFERTDFDDSAFAVGDAGFGSREGYCELNNPGDVRTEWPVETDLLVRKTLELPAGTTDVVVYVAVDNDVQVFMNGYDISDGLQIHEGCPTLDSFSFAVPNNLLQVGTNLLAVRARDRGCFAYLDLEVTRRSRLRLG